jgi:hypothetical protein
MEIEQHTAEKPMGDWSNKGRNQKFLRICWKWKHNLLEYGGHNKGHAKRKDYSYKCLHYKNIDLSDKKIYDVP